MNSIRLLASFNFNEEPATENGKVANVLFSRGEQKLFEVKLSNAETLARHTASSPITVLCLAGSGVFRAGNDLEDEQRLTPGLLIALDAGVAHEVVAEPVLHILVTKF